MKEYFLIQEVATMHQISKKTLLHYDRIGLFCPHHIDQETGYRYYIREQFPFLKQIIYLKRLNLSLDEIKVLLEDRRIEPLLEKLNEKLMNVNRELAHFEEVKYDLTYLINFYEHAKLVDERDLYRPGIKILDERLMIYELCEDTPNSLQVMLAYRKLLRNLIGLNIFSQMPYGTLALEPTENNPGFYDQVGSFIMLPKSFSLSEEKVIPAGKYAYMYKKGGYFDPNSTKMLLDWCKDNGYNTVGNIYDFCIVDYTFRGSDDEMIQEIQVRVA